MDAPGRSLRNIQIPKPKREIPTLFVCSFFFSQDVSGAVHQMPAGVNQRGCGVRRAWGGGVVVVCSSADLRGAAAVWEAFMESV